MQRYRPRRTRYPKRRRTPRILFLLGLPVVLIALLLGLCSRGGDPEPGSAGPPLGKQSGTGGAGAGVSAPGGLVLSPVAGKRLSVEEAYPRGPLPGGLEFDGLLLEKKHRRLTAFAKGKAVRVYLVALGENPVGAKAERGDKRTPEGKYSINGKVKDSVYHRELVVSYPSAEDRARAGSKDPGGNIAIHGLARPFADIGDEHRLTDWTFGSAAVTNEEIEELFQRVPVGTPIIIKP